ncbi:hypothetical protein D3C79_850800 [compost metagenome]
MGCPTHIVGLLAHPVAANPTRQHRQHLLLEHREYSLYRFGLGVIGPSPHHRFEPGIHLHTRQTPQLGKAVQHLLPAVLGTIVQIQLTR